MRARLSQLEFTTLRGYTSGLVAKFVSLRDFTTWDANMKITCLGCKRFVFEIEVFSMEFKRAPIVSLTCPDCGKSTAIQERPGGGIEIALDKHLETTRG